MRVAVLVAAVVTLVRTLVPAQTATLEKASLSGEIVSLDSLMAKGPVLLTFWALWCGPCKEELRAVQSLSDRYLERGFSVVAVNQDSPRSVAKVRAYVGAQQYSFPVILDPDGRILERFGGQAIPFSLLFDTSGKIAHRAIGYLPGDQKKLEQEIVNVLTSR